MINNIRYILTALSALLLLGSCAESDGPNEYKNRPEFSAALPTGASRAVGSQWEAGDKIGITGAGRTNVCYVNENGGTDFKANNPDEAIAFPDDASHKFFAYYPWKELGEGVTEIEFDTKEQDKQKEFDFLTANAFGSKKAPNVTFVFRHLMTKLYITVSVGSGMTFDDIKAAKYSADSIYTAGNFNIPNDTLTFPGSKGDWDFSAFATSNKEAETLTFSLIVAPQDLKNLQITATPTTGTLLTAVKATIDLSTVNASEEKKLLSGMQYNIHLVFNRLGLLISESSIQGWESLTYEGDDINLED